MSQSALLALDWVVVAAFAGLAGFVLYLLFRYGSKLCDMLQEANGKGSVSRFQLVFFTITIGGGYLAKLMASPDGNVELSTSALALLGISGGSYLVSKGISAGGDLGKASPQAADGTQPGATNVVIRTPSSTS